MTAPRPSGWRTTSSSSKADGSGSRREAPLVGADLRTCGLCSRVRLRCQPRALAGRKRGMITWGQVAASLLLVLVAIALSVWRGVPIKDEIGWGVLRSFVQLLALGYVIKLIFDAGNVAWVVPVLVAMTVFGALTARNRAPRVPGALPVLLVSIGIAVLATLGLALAIGAIHATPRSLIPIGGMVIGQSMVAAALALGRLEFEIESAPDEIEARLSLGATSRQAIDPILRRSMATGMLNTIDSTKTAG